MSKRRTKANRRRWASRMKFEASIGGIKIRGEPWPWSCFTGRDFVSKGWNWQ